MNPLQRSGVQVSIPGATNDGFDEETKQRIAAARAAGVPEHQIIQEASAYQAQKGATGAPKIAPKQEDPVVDWLPTIGSVVGGVGGFALGGPVGAIAGAGAGGALGETAKQKMRGQDLNLPEIALQGGLGAVGEGVGSVVGKVAGKVVSGVGKQAVKYGENLTSKALNLTPKMEADVVKKMGEKSLPEFLANRGLHGADYERVAAYTEPVQAQFDEIAKNPNIVVQPKTVVDGFQKQINELRSSILPADRAKADALEQIQQNFIQKYGDNPIPANELTALRINVDKGVKDFGADPIVSSTGNLTRDVLQESIQKHDPTGTLAGHGQELHKLYSLLEKAEPRQFASSGSGLAIGGKDVMNGFLGNIFYGPMGAAVGVAANKTFSTSMGNKIASKGLQMAGNALDRSGQFLPPITGAFGAGAANSVLPSGGQNPQNNEQNNQTNNVPHMDGTLPQITPNVNTMGQQGAVPTTTPSPSQQETTLTGYTPVQIYQAMLKAQAAGDKVNASSLSKMYGDEQKYQITQLQRMQITQKLNKPSAQDQVHKQLNSVIDDMSALYGTDTPNSLSVGKSTTGLTGAIAKAGQSYNKNFNQGYSDRLTQYNSMRALAAGIINKARQAGTLNSGEYEIMIGNMPNEYTSEAAAKAWFTNAKKLLSSLPVDDVASATSNYDMGALPPIE